MIEPRAAATVMVARDGPGGLELFMLRRSAQSAFMPDIYVFPGGRVEPADAAPAARRQLAGPVPAIEPAVVYAAARETFEEAGLLFSTRPVDEGLLADGRARLADGRTTFGALLDDLAVTIDANGFCPFSRWITPPGEARRFDTRFFVARAPNRQAARADAVETHDGLWIAPHRALADHAAGTFALIFPTIKHLERVRGFATVEELLAFAARKPIHPVMPTAQDDRTFAIPPGLEGVW